MRQGSIFASIFVAALAGAAPGNAQDAPSVSVAERSDFNKRIYLTEPGQAKAYACFSRTYDADHLARHPGQKVRAARLLVKSDWDDEDKRVSHSFHLGFDYRGKRAGMESAGQCNHVKLEEENDEIRLGCSIDCDGGGLGIGMSKTDDSVRVSVERIRAWPSGSLYDEEKTSEHVAGNDDGLFRLVRVPLENCAPLVGDKKELATIRKLPGFRQMMGSR